MRSSIRITALALLVWAAPESSVQADILSALPQYPPGGGMFEAKSPLYFPEDMLQEISHPSPAIELLQFGRFHDVTTTQTDDGQLVVFRVDGLMKPDWLMSELIPVAGRVEVLLEDRSGDAPGTFQAELLAMDLVASAPFEDFALRESPTLRSRGSTSITQLGGIYRFDSFFDVFAELALLPDNHPDFAWWPTTTSAPLELDPEHFVAEPATLALAGFGLAGLAGYFWRRRFDFIKTFGRPRHKRGWSGIGTFLGCRFTAAGRQVSH